CFDVLVGDDDGVGKRAPRLRHSAELAEVVGADGDRVAALVKLYVDGGHAKGVPRWGNRPSAPRYAFSRCMSPGVTVICRRKPVCMRTYSNSDALAGSACSSCSIRCRSAGSQSSYSSGQMVTVSMTKASR